MKFIKTILKKLFGRESNGGKVTQRIFGIKFTRVRPLPYEMDIVTRARELKIPFRANLGYDLNLAHPVTFNEKINWMKLYYYDDEMTRIVDKYEFKNYIQEQLGEGFTVPLLGAWDNVEDVDFDSLPEKFVLKCNAQSDSKYIKIVKDKSTLDIDALREEMRDWLRPEKTLKSSFCWAYNNVKLRIIAEEYIEQIDGQVYDYKFMCFHGKPRWVLACCDRGRNTVYENHDMNWKLIVPAFKSATRAVIAKPQHFSEMVKIAKKLSAPFPFVRVDFYEIGDKILLGEMTFYPNGGYNSYKPYWDKKFGDYITLPKVNNKLPFFDFVRQGRMRIVNIWGKKFLSVYRSLSRKELTTTVDNLSVDWRALNNELKNTKKDLYKAIAELEQVKKELKCLTEKLQDREDKQE